MASEIPASSRCAFRCQNPSPSGRFPAHLSNVILDACDAMSGDPRGGRAVTVTTSFSLFTPFFGRRKRRLGRGLAICRSIILEIGGRLRAENKRERGSKLRLAFALAQADASRP